MNLIFSQIYILIILIIWPKVPIAWINFIFYVLIIILVILWKIFLILTCGSFNAQFWKKYLWQHFLLTIVWIYPTIEYWYLIFPKSNYIATNIQWTFGMNITWSLVFLNNSLNVYFNIFFQWWNEFFLCQWFYNNCRKIWIKPSSLCGVISHGSSTLY